MIQPVYNEVTKKYEINGYDIKEGMRGVSVTFRNSNNVSLASIEADGKQIGVVALSNGVPLQTSFCEISGVNGVHDVTFKVDGGAKIDGVEFTKDSPFDECKYVPVPEETLVDNGHDTWEATDMLGRKVVSAEDVGAKNNRHVGIFYWTWREGHTGLRAVNVTKTLEEFPAAEYNRNHPAWGNDPIQPHWNEPMYGFYRNSDAYVIRHHASLLANAGVDFLVFDCTNGALLWRDAYEPVLKGLYEARCDGIKTPQIAFMLNFGPMHETEKMLRALYQDLYKPGKYSDLWYRINGKPFIMAYPEALPLEGASEFDTALLNEIRNFFAFRPGQPLYGTENGGPKRPDHWGWLEIFPQNKYGLREDGSCEMMTVGVGQNANAERICTHFNAKDTFGRSYTYKHKHDLLSKDSYKYGYNVQEQWDRAIDIAPDNVFVTGWNEWMMGFFHDPWVKDKDSTQLAMVDQYDREHSRDIEPDIDGYLDTYYLQLASNIRRYKGASQRQAVSEPKTICDISDFDSVTPYYRSDKGMTVHRDSDGFRGTHYTNDTGRNSIIGAKVARNDEYVWFLAECEKDITSPEGENWMTLYIDTDRSKKSGWEGYDLAVNRLAFSGKASVEKYFPTDVKNSFTWKNIGDAETTVVGNKIMIKLDRKLFGERLNFEFKWSDNMIKSEIMDFYQNGCVAPIGRFNYLYFEKR